MKKIEKPKRVQQSDEEFQETLRCGQRLLPKSSF